MRRRQNHEEIAVGTLITINDKTSESPLRSENLAGSASESKFVEHYIVV